MLKSLLAGASAIANRQQPEHAKNTQSPWDADFLYFMVREPFPCKTSAASLMSGKITQHSQPCMTSLMPENRVIFSDGIETDYIEFNSGIVAELGIAKKNGHLIV
ncbi:hypothetical protein [Collimonas sp. OK307]|uniref:hypothetical protein n=1 Tax=Collimonas sp. OK307 TaxID=1801620 RepID=UPI001113E79F|nr:hypothetical protein [Collimonas sp. OK307]